MKGFTKIPEVKAYHSDFYIFNILAKGPGVARGKKIKIFFCNFFQPKTPPATHKCPQKMLALSYREHILECLVLLYRFLAQGSGVARGKKFQIFLA